MKFFTKLGASIVLSAFAVSAFAANEVSLQGHGQWNVSEVQYSNGKRVEKGFWVDAKVQKLSYDKVVGMVWTDNNWATQQTSYLNYEAEMNDEFERWGIDFNPMGQLSDIYIGSWRNYITDTVRAGGTTTTISYALFYEVDGQTYWDNNDGANYSFTLTMDE